MTEEATNLSTLADRVEAATGPDRELDRAIYDYLNPPRQAAPDEDQPPPGFGADFLSNAAGHWGPNFTSSIDAAMTLVPEGWEWSLENTGSETFGPFVAKLGQLRDVEAKTLPLALTAASLRAMALDGGIE